MSLLRDEHEIALNRIHVICEEAHDRYAEAAERVDAPALAALLHDLARRRDAAARLVRRHVRARGELPVDPDTDTETVHRAVEWVTLALASDEARALLDEREKQEADLTDALGQALRLEWPAAVRADLERLADEAAADRRRLAAARAQAASRGPSA